MTSTRFKTLKLGYICDIEGKYKYLKYRIIDIQISNIDNKQLYIFPIESETNSSSYGTGDDILPTRSYDFLLGNLETMKKPIAKGQFEKPVALGESIDRLSAARGEE